MNRFIEDFVVISKTTEKSIFDQLSKGVIDKTEISGRTDCLLDKCGDILKYEGDDYIINSVRDNHYFTAVKLKYAEKP